MAKTEIKSDRHTKPIFPLRCTSTQRESWEAAAKRDGAASLTAWIEAQLDAAAESPNKVITKLRQKVAELDHDVDLAAAREQDLREALEQIVGTATAVLNSQ